MYLSHLSLRDFRNYKQLDLALGAGLFVFHGENAQGKTNLLEAVGMLAMASSFHASSDREVVNWTAPEHVARIEGIVKRREDEVQIEMLIFDPSPPAHQRTHPIIELPGNTPRKRYKVNSVPKKTIDVIGQMKVVFFAPSDLHLVDGAPEERRRFLDRALCQLDLRYGQALLKYRKIVTQRAALLKRIRENQESPEMLGYLDEQLTMLANYIMYERRRMIDALTQQANDFQHAISGGREQLQIVYRPSFKFVERGSTLDSAQYFQEQLRAVRKKEIMQGVCLLGPHRDELDFLVNDVNMLSYGSRGQQRTTALATKLAELTFMRASIGDEPVLLLDDVFSELDHLRREYLLCQIAQHEQVMITATDLVGFPTTILQQARTYQIVNGMLANAA